MKPDLILHIGTTKTGSTSIQYMLNQNRESLLRQGAYYPATPGEHRHLHLATAFAASPALVAEPDNALWQGKAPADFIASYLVEFEAEIRTLPESVSRVIISAEQFSMFQRTHVEIGSLHDFLAPHFARMTVLVYLRRQDAHFASAYAQFLRAGNVHLPEMDRLNSFHHDYDYADLLARWSRVFGEESIKPRIFERLPGQRFDVVDDFAQACGLDLSNTLANPGRNKNISINFTGQHVLLELGRLLQESTGRRAAGGTTWQRISESLAATSPGTGWQPTRGQARAFMQAYETTNESVRARWFPEKQSLFSRNYDHLPEEPQKFDPLAAFTVANAAWLNSITAGLKREQQLLLEKARLAEKLGDSGAQRRALLQAVRCDGNDARARCLLARFQIEDGNFASARTNIDAALALAPEDRLAKQLNLRLERVQRRAAREKKDLLS
jgi:hypothetical protein